MKKTKIKSLRVFKKRDFTDIVCLVVTLQIPSGDIDINFEAEVDTDLEAALLVEKLNEGFEEPRHGLTYLEDVETSKPGEIILKFTQPEDLFDIFHRLNGSHRTFYESYDSSGSHIPIPKYEPRGTWQNWNVINDLIVDLGLKND